MHIYNHTHPSAPSVWLHILHKKYEDYLSD